MTSPPMSDQKPRVDSVDGLRALVADLRALADRLELKARSHNLRPTLKAVEQRLCGPRAVVMLLSEHEELKRRFLERLLGPHLAQVPKPATACIRLEYGTAMERTVHVSQGVTAPEVGIQEIRLPNPTLKSGLAVIDTPALKSGEPGASVLDCAELADAWILVLNADHELSEAGQALLRRLPEAGARLEIVIENAEALSSEERLAARDRLIETLRERCNIKGPRLTLAASAAIEGEGAGFWQGRFATFHSVMMLRGREHWLEVTRTMVGDALSQVSAEIDFELESIAPGLRHVGLRHARLRLGMKDLEGLRTRFHELGRLEGERRSETGATEARSQTETPRTDEAMPQVEPDIAQTTVTPAEPTATTPAFISFQASDAGADVKPAFSAHLSENLALPMRRKMALLKRAAGVALAVPLICLIIWALSPRSFFFGHEAGAEWDYHSPAADPVSRAAPAATTKPKVNLPKTADSLPETSGPPRPNLSGTPLAKRRSPVRVPLARPIPSGATAGVARPAKRHRRRLLGLGKLWHWVRHGHSKNDTKAN